MTFLIYVTGFEIIASNRILSTLASVQAGIFAIVFSIIVLGVNLSASNYSPRIANLFKSDFYYKWIVGIFGISVGSNLLLLYSIDLISGELLYSLMIFSGFLAIEAFYSLYNFVNRILEKTTPEGVLKTIDNYMSVDYIRSQAKYAQNRKEELDPFYVLVSVVESTISERDIASASLGVEILSEKIQSVINDDLNEEEGREIFDSLEKLSTERIPNLMEFSLAQDSYQIAEEINDKSEQIAKLCVEKSKSKVFENIVRGQSSLVGKMEFTKSEDRLRDTIIESVLNSIKEAQENRKSDSLGRSVRLLGWKTALSLVNRTEHKVFYKYTYLQINGFPKILSREIESVESIEDLDPDSWYMLFERNDPAPEVVVMVDCYNSMCELVSAVIRYEIRTNKTAVDWESVSVGWANCVKYSKENGLREFAKNWYGTILYLAYLDEMSADDVMNRFEFLKGYRPGEEFAEEVIEELIESNSQKINNMPPNDRRRGRIDHLPGRGNPIDRPRTGSVVPPVKDPEQTFSEWLEENKEIMKMKSREFR